MYGTSQAAKLKTATKFKINGFGKNPFEWKKQQS